MGRTENTLRNAFTGFGSQLINNVLRFICRTAFIYILGKEYLGISGLYANILSVLSISELGIGSAIVYSLYKPLALGDEDAVKRLMNFYKLAYRVIGFFVLMIGLCLFPFLPKLMKGTTDKVDIYFYYLLYLVQSVVSYWFFAYKGALLLADQKKYIYDIVYYIVQIIMNISQIAILFLTHSFLIYTLMTLLCVVAQNTVIAMIVDRRYPYLKDNRLMLEKEERKPIYQRVYAMSLYKVSSITLSSTDNLVISSFIGVMAVGVYSNYLLLITTIKALVDAVFEAFVASIGNMYATESAERSESVFRCINFLNFWVWGLCSVCFFNLYQPFIQLWVGKEYLFSDAVMITIVFNYLTRGLQVAVIQFKDASGLFLKGKYRPIISSALNLVLSIILIQKIGIIGVFLATIISRLAVTWWFDALLIYRDAFMKSVWPYYLRYLRSLALSCGCALLVHLICLPLADATVENLLIKMGCSFVIPNLVFYLMFRRSMEFRYLKERSIAMLRKRRIIA